MCVSTAYLKEEGSKVLAEYIAMVKMNDGNIIMTDVMGKETTVKGILKEADLTRGILIIDTPNA